MWIFAFGFRVGVGFDIEFLSYEPMLFGESTEEQVSSGATFRLPFFEAYVGFIHDES